MGKKATQASSKSSNKNHEKKQLSSLIKILKPKVYITDASSFKTLVQQLTGNERTCRRSSSSSSPINPTVPEQVQVPSVNVCMGDEDDDHGIFLEIKSISNEVNSFDPSIDSSLEFCDNQVINIIPEELQQFTYEQLMGLEDQHREAEDYNYMLNMNQKDVDFYSLVYQDVESWLLEVEPYGNWCI